MVDDADLEEVPLPDAVKQILGEKHPYSLFWKSKEGIDLKSKGDIMGAFEAFLEVLDLRKEVLGPDHPDTLDSKTCVAETLEAIGEIDAAYELRQELVEDMSKLYGERSWEVKQCLEDLELTKKACKDPSLAYGMQKVRAGNKIPGKSVPTEGAIQEESDYSENFNVPKDKDMPSHQQLELDENGVPLEERFVHVSEEDCVGCTHCAFVAKNTFFMEEDGFRARAFAQGQDDPEIIAEAIDCCPVNCIAYVDLEDLIILEAERAGMTIDYAAIGLKGVSDRWAGRGYQSKAKIANRGPTCTNCPMRGCENCPMYGVGINPVYEARLKKKKARAEEKERIQQEEDAAVMTARLDKLLGVGWKANTQDFDLNSAFASKFEEVSGSSENTEADAEQEVEE